MDQQRVTPTTPHHMGENHPKQNQFVNNSCRERAKREAESHESARMCFFFGYKGLFWDSKDHSAFWWTPKSFLGYKMFFGIQKNVRDSLGGQKGFMKCEIVLDILEGQKRQGWGSTVGDTKAATKQHRKQRKQQESNTKILGQWWVCQRTAT